MYQVPRSLRFVIKALVSTALAAHVGIVSASLVITAGHAEFGVDFADNANNPKNWTPNVFFETADPVLDPSKPFATPLWKNSLGLVQGRGSMGWIIGPVGDHGGSIEAGSNTFESSDGRIRARSHADLTFKIVTDVDYVVDPASFLGDVEIFVLGGRFDDFIGIHLLLAGEYTFEASSFANEGNFAIKMNFTSLSDWNLPLPVSAPIEY